MNFLNDTLSSVLTGGRKKKERPVEPTVKTEVPPVQHYQQTTFLPTIDTVPVNNIVSPVQVKDNAKSATVHLSILMIHHVNGFEITQNRNSSADIHL